MARWNCEACTFLNHELVSTCEMCDTARVADHPPPTAATPPVEIISLAPPPVDVVALAPSPADADEMLACRIAARDAARASRALVRSSVHCLETRC